jgi:predicted N-formylglutamate amidohydrolase
LPLLPVRARASSSAIEGNMGHAATPRSGADLVAPVRTVNAEGQGPFALVCDHASNRFPPAYDDLGLPPSERIRHIAWDPGALAVSMVLTHLLDAPLVHAMTSRLIVDCNRFTDSDGLMPAVSEYTEIPGNRTISAAERTERIARYWVPFHDAVDRLLAARKAAGLETILVCMHSFTPVFKGVERPWPIGILPAPDEGYSKALFNALRAEDPDMNVGWHEPYAGAAGYSYTVEHHGAGLEATMIEVRNNEILEPAGVAFWADRLARCLNVARGAHMETSVHLSPPQRGATALEGRD